MAVAKRVDGDAAGEIEIALAVLGDQPTSLAPVERQGCTGESLEKRRTAHYMRLRYRKNQKSRQSGGHAGILDFSAVKSTETSA
jgi:hypothetical protein